jgi:type IV secretion system protein VirD4
LPATFAALDKMLADSSRPIQDLWAEMLAYPHINGRNHPVVSASAHNMMTDLLRKPGRFYQRPRLF